jgi:hypothetical protein
MPLPPEGFNDRGGRRKWLGCSDIRTEINLPGLTVDMNASAEIVYDIVTQDLVERLKDEFGRDTLKGRRATAQLDMSCPIIKETLHACQYAVGEFETEDTSMMDMEGTVLVEWPPVKGRAVWSSNTSPYQVVTNEMKRGKDNLLVLVIEKQLRVMFSNKHTRENVIVTVEAGDLLYVLPETLDHYMFRVLNDESIRGTRIEITFYK